jgi:hypothetical protein
MTSSLIEKNGSVTYPAARTVLQRPSLNGTTLRLSHNARLRPISPSNAVDLPLAAGALELECVVDAHFIWREIHISKLSGKLVILVSAANRITDDKAHNFIGVKIWVNVGDLSIRSECDVLILVSTEIKNDFPALSHRDIKLCGVDGLGKEACVRPDDLHVKLGAGLRAWLEVKLPRS